MSKKLFIIDGYGQIFRSYYALMNNPLRDKNGKNVSAVFGFFNTIIMLIRQYRPDYLFVALDSKGKTFRHQLYSDYKANRTKTPEDLHAQIPVIENILTSMKIGHYAEVGMEADDIIATVVKNAKELDVECVMVTGDKDLLQLVDDNTSALRPPRKGEHEYRLCKRDDVYELFGVYPDQICDYLTILGDSSDNVPGIDGIGEKGAVKLLNTYTTLDNAYSRIDEITGSLKTKLENAKDHIPLSKTLVTLKDDLFTTDSMDLASYSVSEIDWKNGAEEFANLGSDKLVQSAKKFLAPGEKLKIEVKEEISIRKENNVEFDSDIEINNKDHLIGYNLKEKIKAEGGVPYFDIMIASWMLDSNAQSFGFEDICSKYLDGEYGYEESVKRLYFILSEKLKERNLDKVFFDLEMPLIQVLSSMEKEGICLDKNKIRNLENELVKECLEIEKSIYDVTGHPFNINSPKQLQTVLFEERNLPTVKKTKSGYSTDSDVLEELSYSTEDVLPSLILRYRALSKLLSTYAQALPTLISPEDGRIHTTFLQTGTATGRLSSKNPNLQNIPVRTEEGRSIRYCFVPKEGYSLLSADYSQIELCVLAHMSQDENLCRAFKEGLDVHRETASLIFDVFPDLVTPQQRRVAKTINFGVIYGMSAFRLSQDLKISRSEAKSFIERYFEKYNGVNAFIEKTKKEAEEKLFVETALGHIRAVPEIGSSNKNLKSAGERIAVNTVIQGTAAEIMKKAMLGIYRTLNERGLKTRLLLQVHDEVILEVPNEEIEEVKALVKNCMENAFKLSIPLRASIETGSSWGEMH